MELYCSLTLSWGFICVAQVGGFEAGALASVEPSVKYHPDKVLTLTPRRNPGEEQCQVGSLTGAVASQRVTEAPKGSLRLNGNQPSSVKAQGSLTVRHTRRAETKVGLSDPTVPSGRAVAYRIKATPGITG